MVWKDMGCGVRWLWNLRLPQGSNTSLLKNISTQPFVISEQWYCSLWSANYLMGAFSAITEATWHYYPYFTNGKAQTGQKTFPSQVDEEFRVEVQFLDLGGNQKINKYILKDSVMWLAAFFFSLPFISLSLLYWQSLQWDVSPTCWKKLFSWQKRKGLFVSHGSP